MNHLKQVCRFFKNRHNKESEEHDILRRVPKHFRKEMKETLDAMVRSNELFRRKSLGRVLYKLKR